MSIKYIHTAQIYLYTCVLIISCKIQSADISGNDRKIAMYKMQNCIFMRMNSNCENTFSQFESDTLPFYFTLDSSISVIDTFTNSHSEICEIYFKDDKLWLRNNKCTRTIFSSHKYLDCALYQYYRHNDTLLFFKTNPDSSFDCFNPYRELLFKELANCEFNNTLTNKAVNHAVNNYISDQLHIEITPNPVKNHLNITVKTKSNFAPDNKVRLLVINNKNEIIIDDSININKLYEFPLKDEFISPQKYYYSICIGIYCKSGSFMRVD